MEVNANNESAFIKATPQKTQPVGYNGANFSNILGKVEEAVIASLKTDGAKLKKEKETNRKKKKTLIEEEEEALEKNYTRSMNQLKSLINQDTAE